MEYSKKQVESDSSSSQESEVIKELDTTSSTKKSYDCTFCKRGFTNAQALGGHMNLHRKDRAKAKQTTKSATIMRVSEDYMNPMYVAPISNDPSRYYPVIDSQSNYVMCYQPSASSPRNPPGHIDRDFMVPRSQSLGMNQELLGAELSLGLGSTCVEDHNDQERRGSVEEAGLDLELCLGRNRNRWF